MGNITLQWRLNNMTPQEYLQEILKNQTLLENSDELKALREERKKVEELLSVSFQKSNPTIRYGGSMAKGTMIRENYDLDIICYFNNGDDLAGKTLEEIYNNVKKILETKYRVVTKTSALRLENKDPKQFGVYFHIDVTPGRYTDDKKNDAFLYQNSGKEKRLKTNLQIHIDLVKDSGLIDTIKLTKLWKIRNGLAIKTFALELLVIEALKKMNDAKGVDVCLKKLWEQLGGNIDNIKIEDPANPTGNDLSELFNSTTKSALSSSAQRALASIEKEDWVNIFGEVDSGDKASKIQAINVISRSSNSPKPWNSRA